MKQRSTDDPLPLRLIVAAKILEAALRSGRESAVMTDEPSNPRQRLAKRVSLETGLPEAQVLELIAVIGTSLPSLIFQARLLKQKGRQWRSNDPK